MNDRASILVYGHDKTLLDTRQWVLERSGYKVLTVTEQHAVERACKHQDVHLVVLCHTLSPRERDSASSTARTLKPVARQLSLVADGSHGTASEGYEVCSLFDGPQALLNTVERLVSTR